MEVYQLIAPAFALYYIYRLVVELRRRKKFLFSNIIWLLFWGLIAILGIIPHEFSVRIANWLGFADNINAIIFIALAFLTILSFYLSAKLDKMERKVTDLVRQLALDEHKIRNLESRGKKTGKSTKSKATEEV